MIDGKSVLAVIPARGGSKGLPGKNIKPFAGLPLIAWSIKAAKHSQYIDRIVVSTDDNEIASIAKAHGGDVPFLRPSELAQDNTTSADVILNLLSHLNDYQLVVMLQPTSPLRTSADIDSCIELSARNAGASVVSVTLVTKPPQWMFHRSTEQGKLSSFLSSLPMVQTRQEAQELHVLNGAVYVSDVNLFKEQKGFLHANTLSTVMPASRSIDIDTQLDFSLAEYIAGLKEDSFEVRTK